MRTICALSPQGKESALAQLETYVKPEYFQNKRAWLEWISKEVWGESCPSVLGFSIEIQSNKTKSGNPEHIYFAPSDFEFELV